MKKNLLFFLLGSLLMLLVSNTPFIKPTLSTGEMIEEWQRAKVYTKEYLEAMPEEGYSFKPTPEMKTFAQQYLHLAGAQLRYMSKIVGKADPVPDLTEFANNPQMQSKAAVTKTVMDSYDVVIETLMGLNETQLKEKAVLYKWELTKDQIFFKGFEHQTHHRGQTTVYFRLKGVTPPGERLF